MTIRQDLRLGLRSLLRRPGFTFVAVFTLALGIGATGAIFSVVNALLLDPLPYDEPQRILRIWSSNDSREVDEAPVTPADFADWREQSRALRYLAVFRGDSLTLTGDDLPRRIVVGRVSDDFFHVFGSEPEAGRFLTSADNVPGKDRVIVLGYGLWQQRFGRDPAIVGRSVILDGEDHVVLGVMPRTFRFPDFAEAWVPLTLGVGELSRDSHSLWAVARLAPEATQAQARAELETICSRLEQEYPKTNTGWSVRLESLTETIVGDLRLALWVLFGATGLVLLIACSNVANLLIAQTARRNREIAMRTCLGATRRRIAQRFFCESLILAVFGGALGLFLASLGIRALIALDPAHIPRLEEVAIDGPVLAFISLIALSTVLLFGLVPALQATGRIDLFEALGESGGRATTRFGRRVSAGVVVCQVALALVLLIGAGLLIKSFYGLIGVDPGFDADNLLSVQMMLSRQLYPSSEQRAAFLRSSLEGIASLPAVESVGAINFLPFTGMNSQEEFSLEGHVRASPADRIFANLRTVSPDYFTTMRIPLVEGRVFTAQDMDSPIGIVLVNEAAARQFWPGENAVGKRLKPGGDPESDLPWFNVEGIVGDVRHFSFESEAEPEVYFPYPIDSFDFKAILIRTAQDPTRLVGPVRQEIQRLNPSQAVFDVKPMRQLLSDSVAKQRFSTFLLSVFAGVALVLAAVGLYALMSYAVSQRTHELGIRIALGARRSDIIRLILGNALLLTGIGLAIGLLSAFALNRVMQGLLFGISSVDPAIFILVILVLLTVTLLANLLPARRATCVDPMVALRYE